LNVQSADSLDTATQFQPEGWLDQALQYLSQLQWPTLEDAQVWSEIHPDAVLLGGVFLGLICLIFGVGWWVGRMPVAEPTPTLEEPQATMLPDLELRLGISREDFAEVGLPLLTPPRLSESVPISLIMTSLEELSTEHLMVVARYCVWKGDAEGARDAIAPIMARGDTQQRHAALALLEGC
jgi:hypothetical protein